MLLALLLMAGNMTMQAQDTIGYSTDLFAAKSGNAVTHLQDFDPEYSEWLYYDNGMVHVENEYCNDNPCGKWKLYDEEGTLIFEGDPDDVINLLR